MTSKPSPRQPFTEPHNPSSKSTGRGKKISEEDALRKLAALRAELLRELESLEQDPDYLQGQPAHECCTRRWNRMRITPLEARAIQLAFRRDPSLRSQLTAVLQRLRRELPKLRDNDQRQPFDCPLLAGTRCLVHATAKPIGCLAWNPAPSDSEDGRAHYTDLGWSAFETRDQLTDGVYGADWKSRVIPLWLRRVFADELARTSDLAAINDRASDAQRLKRPKKQPRKH